MVTLWRLSFVTYQGAEKSGQMTGELKVLHFTGVGGFSGTP